MDFALATRQSAPPVMLPTGGDPLYNKVWLSLNVTQGSWWFDPTFGLKARKRRKITADAPDLLVRDYRQALAWLLSTRQAASIDVTASRVEGDRTRIRMSVKVVAVGGRKVTYEKFVEVV